MYIAASGIQLNVRQNKYGPVKMFLIYVSKTKLY